MNDDAGGKSALSDGLGPLPEYAQEFRPRWFGDEGGFSGAQMRLYALAAVAAERERCAQWYAEKGWLLDEDDVPDAMRKA